MPSFRFPRVFPHTIPFTVFDVETTGLQPRKGDRIVEIAGFRVEGGIVNENAAFASLVNPERSVPEGAGWVHNIPEKELIRAPSIREVLPGFLSFAGGSVLVAHNAEFDCAFLEEEKEACWGYVEIPECLCTLALSRALFPREYQHNLDAVARRLKLKPRPFHHRALSDALLTAQALLKLIEIGRIQSIEELREKAGITGKVAQ